MNAEKSHVRDEMKRASTRRFRLRRAPPHRLKFLRHAVLAGGLLLSGTASPAKKGGNSLAVHPLTIAEINEKEEIELRKIFGAEVQRLESDRAAATHVQGFLKSLKHRTCAPAADLDDCLARLAQAAHARRTLFVSLHLYPKIRLAGRVVRETGEVRVAAQREFGKYRKKTGPKTLKRAFRQFLASDLRLGHRDLGLPPPVTLERPVEKVSPEAPTTASKEDASAPKPVAAKDPTLPPKDEKASLLESRTNSVPPPKDERASLLGSRAMPLLLPLPREMEARPVPIASTTTQSYDVRPAWKSTLGYSLLGTGAVAGGLGLFFRLKSSSHWKDYNASQGYLSPAQAESLRDLGSKAESEGTAGTALLVGAGALMAGGIALLVLDHRDTRSGEAVRIVPQPAGVLVSGRFR